MTENLAAPAPRDDAAPSILAPRRRVRVSPWLLVLALAVGFAGGWITSLATQTTVSVPCACGPIPPSATPTPELDTEDDSIFVDLATRDIDDFAKDLGDMSTTLDENGYWRLLSNSVELNFNLSQLEGHEEPTSIASDWNDALDELGKNVDAIEAGVTANSEKKIRAGIADARDTVAELREIVSRVD
jgi:hypothetical protein